MPERIGLEAVLEDANFQAGLARYMTGVNTMDSKTQSVVKSLTTGYTNLGDKVLSVAGTMATAVVTGAAAATAAVVGFGVSGIKAASEMEAQVSGIAAVLNKTRDEVAPLNDLILDLGLDPRLKVTATEAANAIELLARNGLDMTQIMDGAAFSTVLLANATGAEFGLAADIATDAMSIFNIEADKMGGVVDSITSVTTNSKFTIDDYNLALRNGGAAAAMFRIPLEDFNTVVALSAEEMGSGMRAGTGFRNFLMRLTPNSNQAADAMRELGLITADGSNAFFDAEGQLKSMEEITALLNETMFGTTEVMTEVGGRTAQQNEDLAALRDAYFKAQSAIHEYELGVKGANLSDEARAERIADQQAIMEKLLPQITDLEGIQGDLISTTKELTDEERNRYLETIFGQDALGTAIALSTETGESYRAMMDQMGETSAVDNAETRMDNFAGAMEILKGIIDTIKIQVGNEFLPLLTEWTRGLSDMASDVGPKIVDFFGDIAHAIGEFIRGATSEGGFDPLLGAMEALDDILPEDTIDRIWDFIDAVEDMGEKAAAFVQDHGDALLGALKAIGGFLAGAAIAAIIAKIAAAIALLLSPVGLVAIAVAALGAAWETNFLNIQGRVAAAIEFINQKLNLIRAWIDENRPMIEAFWDQTWGRVVATLQEVGEKIGNFLVQQFQKVTDWIAANRPLIEAFFERIATVAAALGVAWTFVWTNVIVNLIKFWDVIQPILGGAIDLVLGLVETVMQLVTGDFNAAWETFKETIRVLFVETLPAILTAFADWVAGWFGSTWAEVVTMWQEIWDNVQLVVSTIWNNIVEAVTEKAADLWEGIVEFFNKIRDSIEDKIEEARRLATDIFEGIRRRIIEIVQTLFDAMGIDLKKFTETWSGYFEDLRAIGEEIFNRITDAISAKMLEIEWAIRDKWEEISTAVSEKLTEIWTEIVSWLTSWYDAGVDLVTELKNGAVQIFEETVDEAESRIEDIIEAVLEFLDPFLEVGRDLITKIREGFTEQFEEVKGEAETKTEDVVEAIKGYIADFLSAGSDLIQGLIDGVLAKAGELISTVTGTVGDAIAQAKALLGIDSPSKIFYDIGINIGQGLIDGIDAMQGSVMESIGSLLDVAGNISSVAGGFAGMFEEDVLGLIESNIASYQEELDAVTTSVSTELGKSGLTEEQADELERLQGIYDKTLTSLEDYEAGLKGASLSEEDLAEKISELQSELDSTSAAMDPLLLIQSNAGLDQDDLINAYFSAIAKGNDQMKEDIEDIWKLQGLVSEEKQKQLEAQGELNALQLAQKELAFLQQQMDLLDLIAENGLDSDMILGGLELGLGADMGGVLNAMTAAMNQLIFEAQSALQIASPSKVMKDLGQMTMKGFELGIVDQAGRAAAAVSGALSRLYEGTIEPILSPLVNPTISVQPAPVSVQGGNTYQLNTSTNASSMSVQQSFKLMEMTDI